VQTKQLCVTAVTVITVSLLAGAAPAAQAADSPPPIGLKLIAEGFVSPIGLTTLDDGSGRLLVADQIGTVHVMTKDGQLQEKLFLDLRPKLVKQNLTFDERGIVGLTLHPRFKENRKLYVYYSAPLREGGPAEWDHTDRVCEYKVFEDDRAQVDPASERVLLAIDKPYFNHNCGRLVFGPDGYLYIGIGDGGNANDMGRGHSAQGNAQELSTLMGKILRLDVDKGDPYAIPADNPFADGRTMELNYYVFRGGKADHLKANMKPLPEIFAYGLRNPWGLSFDRGGTHELFAADVGQDSWEEIDIIVKGGNYGWNIREGFVCFDPEHPLKPPEDCPKVGPDGKPLIDPIVAYKNFKKYQRDPEARGTSVTGGYVYRGKAIPSLQGCYVFADWSRSWVKPDGVLYVLTRAGNGWTMEPLDLATDRQGQLKAYVVALGEDTDGELYVMTNPTNGLMRKGGRVLKLVPM
jgi:glucose/arabinose dehydrogenase